MYVLEVLFMYVMCYRRYILKYSNATYKNSVYSVHFYCSSLKRNFQEIFWNNFLSFNKLPEICIRDTHKALDLATLQINSNNSASAKCPYPV
jgi:hypothetical protein